MLPVVSISLRLGARVASFRYTVLNAQGAEIVYTYGNIAPDQPSQQLQPVGPPALGDQEARDLLLQELDFLGMEPVSLDVQTGRFARENTQFLRIELSAAGQPVEKHTELATRFFGGSRAAIEELNSRHGTQISLLRVIINGSQGEPIAHYILDLDLRWESARLSDGSVAPWFPRPALVVTETPQPTPAPSETLPPSPTAGPTADPYP